MRPGSSMFEVATWEEAEMLRVNIYDFQDNLEKEWDKVACGRYRMSYV
jgi:hypothetical protein